MSLSLCSPSSSHRAPHIPLTRPLCFETTHVVTTVLLKRAGDERSILPGVKLADPYRGKQPPTNLKVSWSSACGPGGQGPIKTPRHNWSSSSMLISQRHRTPGTRNYVSTALLNPKTQADKCTGRRGDYKAPTPPTNAGKPMASLLT